MRLVVTEKPSVARDLGKVLGVTRKGRGCLRSPDMIITWCVGHLVELEEPAYYNDAWRRWSLESLPMVPEHFELRARGDVNDQWDVVRALLTDERIKDVVNACDAGREGELIFRYVYDLAGCKRPVLRLWVSSLTDEAIRDAWRSLRPGRDFDPLADAARCRSEADWLVGLNATRAMTCLARSRGDAPLLTVGRVQTPTLAMVALRDREISDFKPEPFYQIKAQLKSPLNDEMVTWEGTWFQPDEDAPPPRQRGAKKKGAKDEDEWPDDRLRDKKVAEAIQKAAYGTMGRVSQANRRKKTEKQPLLYDLTSLQQRANQRFGFSAQQTLDIAQALYEKHKLITYPRTDARYLTPDQAKTLKKIVTNLRVHTPYETCCDEILSKPIKPGKRVINAKEVGDHHAILPTSKKARLERLNEDERRIFDLVARRLLAALSKEAIFDMTTLVVSIGKKGELAVPDTVNVPLLFRSRGRVLRQSGWRSIDPPGKSKDVELPAVQRNAKVRVVDSQLSEGKTRPPRYFNDGSLLRAMETAGRALDDAELKRALRGAGLGTPATRANIIQTLIKRGFMRRQRRDLRATDAGMALIDAIPLAELKSAALTGQWEARLSSMAEGKDARQGFMVDVAKHVRDMIDQLRTTTIPAEALASMPASKRRGGGRPRPQGPSLGSCPLCKKNVFETPKAYTCESGRECNFVIFKTMSKHVIDVDQAKLLLKDKRTPVFNDFKSKAGRDFSAALVLGDDGRVTFAFPDRDPSPPPQQAPPRAAPAGKESAPTTPVGMRCPSCYEGRLIKGRTAWGCDRWRAGCQYRLPFEHGGKKRSDAAAAKLVAKAQQRAS